MNKFYSLLFCSFCFINGSFAQTAIDPNGVGSFDAGTTFPANGWTVVNSSGNEWVVGTGASASPPSSPNTAYISSDGNPGNYSYDNTTTHISHFYKQVTLPPEAFNIVFSFYLQGDVQSDNDLNVIDGLDVFTDVTSPVADAMPGPSAVLRFPQFNSQLGYIQEGFSAPDLAGKTFYLIFTWVNNNDGIGDGPPASVDGISLTYCIKAANYNVTGGGAFCTGSSGVGVGLAGSTKGISYQLYNNGNPVGDLVVGTGAAINFGPQISVGNYTVVGTSACNDTYPMPGSVNVSENPLPEATAGSNAPLCIGATLSLNSGGGATYSWSGPNGFTSTDQNPSITNFTSDAAGTYTVTVTSDKGCSAPATTEVTVTAGGAKGGTIPSVSICSGGNGILALSGNSKNPDHWESTTDSTSVIWDKITNTNTMQNFSGVTVPTFFRAVVSDGCSVSYSDTATVSIHNYWTGTNSSDWNTNANWSDGQLPSASSCPDVFIPGGTPNQPVLNNTPKATITNLHIFANATLMVDNATMQIAGTIDNLGAFIASKGTMEFNGSGTQTIDGSKFDTRTIENLVVSNNDLRILNTVNDTLNVTGLVSFGTGTAALTTGDNLTLKSTKDNTASIGTLKSSNSVSGKVEVERYINIANGADSHGKKWQLLATPTQGQTLLQSWMENKSSTPGYGAQFTGTAGTSGFDASSIGPSVKYWDDISGTWVEIGSTPNTPLYNPRGYLTFIRGDRSVDGRVVTTATPTTLRSKGTITTGPVSFTVPKSSSVNNFFSIGNPYPSTVDMTQVTTSINSIDELLPFIYVWNPNLGGEYGVGAWDTYELNGSQYFKVPGQTLVAGTIQSGQAFLVQTDANNQRTVPFSESNKLTTSTYTNFRSGQLTGNAVQLVTSLLTVNNDGSTTLTDGTLQQFNRSYTNKVNSYDARKIMNSANNFSIKSGGVNLIVERRAPLTEQDTIQYNMANMGTQNYRLEFKAQGLSAEGVEGFVEDTYLNTRTPLNMEGTTDVNFAITSDKGSSATGRFRIVFKTATVLPVKIVSVTAEQKDANIEVDWKVENEHTVKLYAVEKSIDGVNFKEAYNVAAGNNGDGNYQWLDVQATPGYNYYRIRMEDQSGQISYSSVVKALIPFGKPSIGIYPNPITDGIVHLQLTNQPKGKYGIRLLNPLGQTIAAKQIEHAGGNATENLKWDYSLAHGVYELQVLKPDGKIQVIKVMY